MVDCCLIKIPLAIRQRKSCRVCGEGNCVDWVYVGSREKEDDGRAGRPKDVQWGEEADEDARKSSYLALKRGQRQCRWPMGAEGRCRWAQKLPS